LFGIILQKSDEDYYLQINYLAVAIPTVLVVQATVLRSFGQPWIASSGKIYLWTSQINGCTDNSQHLTDWYTFTHVLHGFIFYYLSGTFFFWEGVQLRFLLAFAVECIWEIIENSPVIIKRYRATALAQGYSGDTIINSLSDNVAMSVGFWMAHFLPAPVIIGLSVAEEIILAAIIRDNLLLNVINIIAPTKAIADWQKAKIKS